MASSPPPLLVPPLLLPLVPLPPVEPLLLVEPLPEVPLLEVSPLVEPEVEPLPLEPVLLPMLPLEPLEPLAPVWSLPVAEPLVPPVWPLVEPVLEPLWPLMEPLLEPLCGSVLEPVLEPVWPLIEPVEPVLEPLCDWSLPVVEPLVLEPLVCANRTVTPTISTAIINNKTFFIVSPPGSRPASSVCSLARVSRAPQRPAAEDSPASALDRFKGYGEGCPALRVIYGEGMGRRSCRFFNGLQRRSRVRRLRSVREAMGAA
jgi:hypothetical protein